MRAPPCLVGWRSRVESRAEEEGRPRSALAAGFGRAAATAVAASRQIGGMGPPFAPLLPTPRGVLELHRLAKA